MAIAMEWTAPMATASEKAMDMSTLYNLYMGTGATLNIYIIHICSHDQKRCHGGALIQNWTIQEQQRQCPGECK
jgi:hypothetical protein